MAPASRPTPGAPIESAWGGQVHDVAVLARGVIVSGAATATKGAKLDLGTVIAGAAALVDLASNEFVAPVDGVYEYLATISGTGAAAGAQYFSHVYYSASSTYAGISGTAPTAGGTARRLTQCGLLILTAGARIYAEVTEPQSGGSMSLDRASFRLVAAGLG